MRDQDSDLDYLNTLDKAEYEREFKLIVNSIYGLAGLAREEGIKQRKESAMTIP